MQEPNDTKAADPTHDLSVPPVRFKDHARSHPKSIGPAAPALVGAAALASSSSSSILLPVANAEPFFSVGVIVQYALSPAEHRDQRLRELDDSCGKSRMASSNRRLRRQEVEEVL